MTLWANTAAFAIAFAAWILLGPTARIIGEELMLSPTEVAWLKAIPILTGSIIRVPVGVASERFGARVSFSLMLAIGAVSTLGLSLATSFSQLLVCAAGLGVVGATFVVGVHAVSAATLPEKRGLALGIFGAANVGSALTTALMPLLLTNMSWRDAVRLYALSLLLSAVVYVWVTSPPSHRGNTSLFGLLRPLQDARVWQLGLYYMATFGVFVGVSLLATDLFVQAYGLSLPLAGAMATVFTFTSSLMRIPGGWLSDRFEGKKLLSGAFLFLGLTLTLLSFNLSLLTSVGLLFLAGVFLGVGVASTLQCMTRQFPRSVAVTGGVVGTLGGLAGFFLPLVGNLSEQLFFVSHAQLYPMVVLVFFTLMVQLVAPFPSEPGA